MKILYLTFYFDPDLSAGSFRNTALVRELSAQLGPDDHIHVITTQPNRYKSFKPEAPDQERWGNVLIERIAVPAHASGLLDQIRSFSAYYSKARRLTKNQPYDRVIASSSRLFTATLGARLARKYRIPLYLDIRDLFRENILEVLSLRRGLDRLASLGLRPVLWSIERYTFQTARHINLVSEGFRPYFNSFRRATYSYFTNGIDTEFLNFPASSGHSSTKCRTILYAGNIGEGQGLHKIIPQAARLLGANYRFVIIGAGGAVRQLEEAIRTEGTTNVDLQNPVSRRELVEAYQKADYLLLHLNDLKAFEYVLPSKLFDYGATDKPILAGVAGYAAQFVQTHLINAFLFAPGDVTALVGHLRNTTYQTKFRADFIDQFQRQTIVRTMAQRLLRRNGLD